MRERGYDQSCDLLLFLKVRAGAGSCHDPPDISPRHGVNDNAESGRPLAHEVRVKVQFESVLNWLLKE